MLRDAFDRSRMPTEWMGMVTRLLHEGWNLTHLTRITQHYEKNDAIIRINRNYDYGFANYAELSLNVPSPHFVQFGWHQFLQDDTHVALLEKLHPAPDDRQASKELKPTLRTLWQLGNSLSAYTGEELSEAGYSGLKHTDMARDMDENYLKATMKDLSDHSPGLAQALGVLQSNLMKLAENDFRFPFPVVNLSPGNIMLRRDEAAGAETIVIADPYAYDYRTEDSKWDDDDSIDVLYAVFGEADIPDLKVYTFNHSIS